MTLESLFLFVFIAAVATALAIALRAARDKARAFRIDIETAEKTATDLRRTVNALTERLAAQADWHAMTLTSITDAVVTTDPEGRVQSLNAAAEAWTGWRSDDAHGMPLEEVLRIVDPLTQGNMAPAFREDVDPGQFTLRDREVLFLHRDGTSRFVTGASVPIVDQDGRRLGFVLTFHDVSGRRDAAAVQQRLLDTARDAEQSARFAHQALQAAHEKFAAFMANFPYPAFIQDERGAFVFVNEAGLASSGWREATASVDGSAGALPETISAADSDCHYFSIRFPLTIEGQVWLGGIAIDISERVRAERTLSERTADFETLFDNVPAPLWIARDASAREIVGNAAANRLLGLPPGTGAFRPFDEEMSWRFVRDGHSLPFEQLPLRICIAERRVVHGTDLEVVRADGTRSHVRATAAPLLDAKGEVRGAVAAALDISQLKEYEAELERAVRRRDEFLAVLAHELRNPLAPIRNSVQILQKVPADVERVRRATDTIDRQTSLMVRLIDDLLDVARVSQGLVELDFAPRTVSAIVTGAIEIARANAPSTGHSIIIEHEDPTATVLVDGLRAEQIVVNLLSNAMKYSPRHTQIAVRSRVENGYAKIAVIDQGQGIPKEFLSEIFTMFARPARAESYRIGGLGVGLALAKQLAEQLGGGIDVASEGRDRGATFTVSFPLARTTANVVR